MKKRIFAFGLIFFCIAFAFSPAMVQAGGDEITVLLHFSSNDLQLSKVQNYDLVQLHNPNARLAGKPGEPWLPLYYARILLPPGTCVSKATLNVLQSEPLEGDFHICPAQPQHPVSSKKKYPFVEPDPKAYSRSKSRHPLHEKEISTIVSHGYTIASIPISPFGYIPAKKKASLHTNMELIIRVKEDKKHKSVEYKKKNKILQDLIEEEVLNPEMMDSYVLSEPETLICGAGSGGSDDVAYLMISSQELLSGFQPLLDWKIKKGVPAESISVEDIQINFPGNDLQEKIRNCIKDYATNKGTMWVVLGGDSSVVPDRDCYGYVAGYPEGYEDFTIPTDLYYAELDSDWDGDEDGIFGEVEDDIDLGADIFIGRLPVRSNDGVTTVVNKTLWYEKTDFPESTFTDKMLLSGSKLWYLHDAEYKSEKTWNSWIHPWWADGMRWRLYDTATDFEGGDSYDVTPQHINEQLENGYNYLHMACHGGPIQWCVESCSYLSFHALQVRNIGKYTNIMTIACDTNAFDDEFGDPCLSEAFMRSSGGAVSYYGGSRYGWDINDLYTQGTSWQYDNWFYRYLFKGEPEEYQQQIGALCTKVKNLLAPSADSGGTYRWCHFSNNLMGDPELCLHTKSRRETFVPVYDDPASLGTYSFVVETGEPRARVCLMNGDDIYTYGLADETGRYASVITLESGGTFDITITAPDYVPFEDEIAIYDDNDECYSAMHILNDSTTFFHSHLSQATMSSDPWSPCAVPPPSTVDLWYRIHPSVSQLVTVELEADLEDAGFAVYSGSCNNLELVDCVEIDPKEFFASLEFVTDIYETKDYYIRLYGYPIMGGFLHVDWEPTMQGNVCENPLTVYCDEVYDIDNPIPGYGDDMMPCMSGYQYPVKGQWLQFTVPAETKATFSVTDWDLNELVGIAFYDECGNLSSPIDSICEDWQTSLSYINLETSEVPLLVLINSNLWSMQPQVTISCETAQYGQSCDLPQAISCPETYDIDHPIPGRGEDVMPCMEGLSYPVASQWLEITVYGGTYVEVSVYDVDLGQMVGIGFYDSCEDVSAPLYSVCAGEYVSMVYANPDPMAESENIKILVNFCSWSMQPTISLFCEETRYGQFCTGGYPAGCETIFNTSNPIEVFGTDLLPCMQAYPGLHDGRWIDFTIPMETILNISVEGYNPSDIVGAGFYETCGDLSSPLNSCCGEGYVAFAWDNPSQDPLPIKILVNSPYWGPHPEISLFCMPYH